MKRLLNVRALVICASAMVGLCAINVNIASGEGTPYAVLATIHPPSGSQSGQKTVSVTAGQLLQDVCPLLLPDASQGYLSDQPGGQGFYSEEYSWSLATVLACGMDIPVDTGLQVAVDNPGSGGAEKPLSGFQLDPSLEPNQPSPWDIPSGFDQNALPLITTAGTIAPASGSGSIVYYRPWEGGPDNNSLAEVSSGTQISIEVYPDAASLVITPSVTTNGLTATFSASVAESNGTSIAQSNAGLSWSWTFDDGSTATGANPVHTFSTPGRYSATVNVTLGSLGLKGTATIPVTVGSLPSTTTTVNPGTGGTKHGKAPNGPGKSSGKTPGAPAGNKQGTSHHTTHKRHHKQPTHQAKQTSPEGTGIGTGSGTGTGTGAGGSGSGSGIGSTGGQGTSVFGTSQGTAVAGHSTTHPGAGGVRHRPPVIHHQPTLVQPLTGVLVSSQTPSGGAAGRNNSGSGSSAPGARAKAPTPIPPAVIAGAAALLLLGFGIAREIHHGRRPRPRRLPSWPWRRTHPST